MAEVQDDEHRDATKGLLVVHNADLTSQEFTFLQELETKLGAFLWNTESTGEPDDDPRKLERFQKLLRKYDRVILAFPGQLQKDNQFQKDEQIQKDQPVQKDPLQQFRQAQLVMAINEVVKRQRPFVTVILYANEYYDLPAELQEFNIRRIMVSKITADIDGIVQELAEPGKLDLAYLNFGNGLAWSYYFGYLSPILPDLRQIITDWEKGRNIPKETISKVMIIYPKIEIMKKDLKGKRLIFHKNEKRVNRAGIDRKYEVDVREVKSRDLSETYYGVADYVNALKLLVTMGDNYRQAVNTEDAFLAMDEATMVKQGRYFYERLRLFLESGCMQKYNLDIGIDGSKFELVEYDTPRSADEETLVDDLLLRTERACLPRSVQALDEGTEEVGIICLPDINDDIKNFIGELQRSCSTVNLFGYDDFAKAIGRPKRIFMVLCDDLVNATGFEECMYSILRQGYSKNNRGFLVCLDCLDPDHPPANHPELELLILFKRIMCSDTAWKQKVAKELESDPQEITYDLMFHNIGKGFALSYYNGFLKFRIPSMRNIVVETPYLMDKFRSRLMSHKLFILHPHSCKTKKKVSDGEARIKDRDEDEELKAVKFPEVINDRRVFTPKLSSITDTDGKKYIAFLEFNTQAETLRRMVDQRFLDENLLSAEWERFSNTLSMLINDEHEPLGLRHRLQYIRYDDRKMTDCDLADVILQKVKEEIVREDGVIESDNMIG